MKVITIVGARPQFIKAAMVSRALQSKPNVTELLVHTGQHYDDDMSNQFFRELNIQLPDYRLEVGSATHAKQTAKILETLEPVLHKEAPDWVLVYGDTNSTLAGALAASQMNIPLAHVEAGLRSFNIEMPEEKNRIVADHLADVLFAPTLQAVSNLEREGIGADKVRLVGDVMYDAALYYSTKSDQNSHFLVKHNLQKSNYVLATVHRAENTDKLDRLRGIIDALVKISDNMPVVLPLHPRTKKQLQQGKLLDVVKQKLLVIAPVGYLDMVALTKNAALVITDSGGLQKEAYFFDTPCLTLRNESEWVELIELGVNKLVGADTEKIVEGFGSIKQGFPVTKALYGDGHASEHIVRYLISANS